MFTCNQMVKEESNKMTDFFKKNSKRKSSETEIASPVKRQKTTSDEATKIELSQSKQELESSKVNIPVEWELDEEIENINDIEDAKTSQETEPIITPEAGSSKTCDPGLTTSISPFDFDIIKDLPEETKYEVYCEVKHIPCGFCLLSVPLNKVNTTTE